jgi:hypothetical protein
VREAFSNVNLTGSRHSVKVILSTLVTPDGGFASEIFFQRLRMYDGDYAVVFADI